MQLSEIRPDIAAETGRPPQSLREFQNDLYASDRLRAAGLAGHRGRDTGPVATYSTVAMLILGAMLGDRRTLASRVERLWFAEYHPIGHCRISRSASLGEALGAVLLDANIRRKLLHFDIDVANDAGLLVWEPRLGRPSVFHPHGPEEWARRVAAVRVAKGMTMTLRRLPAGSFDKLAARFEEVQRQEAIARP
jgi:hypothetical protein